MEFEILKISLADIQPLRNLFLSESGFQFVHNKCHGAGWADTYAVKNNRDIIGYGSVWGKDRREDRDTIFEFYLLPSFRKSANIIFLDFIKITGVPCIECQTNDKLLARMFFENATNVHAEAILFEDRFQTELTMPDICFKKNQDADGNFEYVLEQKGEIVGTGGYVWNYNFPYIDMYYEVREEHRRKGFGSLITQELKKEAYRLNRIPAARCNVKNSASKGTLLKAGMGVCGYLLVGELALL